MIGFSRILGDFVIKTALLKIHLWYVQYYSPIFKSLMSYLLFLEENALLNDLTDLFKNKVPHKAISSNDFTV